MNRNGKLNRARGFGDVGSASPRISVSRPNTRPMNLQPAPITEELQNTGQVMAADTKNPQPQTTNPQRSMGVSGSKIQGTVLQGRAITKPPAPIQTPRAGTIRKVFPMHAYRKTI